MKMKLKNKKQLLSKIKIKLTKKNLLIFLISFLIISIIIGIIFYVCLNSQDKLIIKDNINNYFTLKNEYNYINLLKDSLINNLTNTTLSWILGISVIGIIFVLFIFFSSLFSIGFTTAAIIDAYGLKGILATILYLFPTNIIEIINTFILTFFAVKISIQIIRICFFKQEINLQEEIKKYTKILLITLIISILCSILEIFVNPFMIKLFTFI